MFRSLRLLYLAIFILCIPVTSSALVESWTFGQTNGQAPEPRWSHTAIYDNAHDRMIIYGGYTLDGRALGDIWALNESTMTWTQLHANNPGPTAITSHAAIYDAQDQQMVVFGGIIYPQDYITNEIWILDLNTMLWEHLTPSGDSWPSERRCLNAAYRSLTNEMIIYGGRYYSHFADTWIFDLTARTWRQVNYQNEAPAAREGVPVTLITHNTDMLVYGGWDEQYFDDLWILNIDSGTWTQYHPPQPHPIPRNYNSAIYDDKCGSVFIFGGYSAYEGPGLNDLWQIDLSDMSYHQLAPAGDIPAPRGRHTTITGGFAGHGATIFGGCNLFQVAYNDVYFFDWDCWVDVNDGVATPTEYAQLSSYPNPFNAQTSIKYNLDTATMVSLCVYDILGKKIAVLADGPQEAGDHQIIWDARDFSSGIYFARLETRTINQNVRMVLLK